VARQHNAPKAPVARGTPIIERKQKADGRVAEYACTLVHFSAWLTVIEFVLASGPSTFKTPIPVPPGTVSHGYFWLYRPYNLYRMRSPAGEVVAHRFDAVAGVRLSPELVSYRDLALDWWVTPDDGIIEEDRDEFEALVAAGRLSPRDIEAARAAEQQVYSRYRHIIDEAAALERRFKRAEG
jgi:hypothetical protein